MMKVADALVGCMQATLQKRFELILLLAMMQLCTTPLLAASVQPGCDSNRQCSAGALCETWTSATKVEHCVLRTEGVAIVFRDGGAVVAPGVTFPLSVIEVTGPVDSAKVARLRNIMAQYKPVMPSGVVIARFSVMINSPGGDVYAAMELGRLFRSNQVQISLDRWTTGRPRCASACILAWVGAPMRLLGGMPGDEQALMIHRPYGVADAGQDLSTSSNRWKAVQADIQQYLLEMNIPPALLDAMNEVSSEDARALTSAELSRYLLSDDDPAFTELKDASEAKKRGISRSEYLSRKRRVTECMKNPKDSVTDLLLCDKLYDTAADESVRTTR